MKIQEHLNDVVFFLIEKTNKMSKQFAATKFKEAGIEVTVDQWVLMKFIHEHPGSSQTVIAENAFKDAASITRMLDILAKKGYLNRNPIENNRRQFSIDLTDKGVEYVQDHIAFVQGLRDAGTAGMTEDEIKMLKAGLLKIQKNMS